MTAVEQIELARKSAPVDWAGEKNRLSFHRGLTQQEIASIEQRVGLVLPQELRALLASCSGIDTFLDGIDFTGAKLCFEQKEVFPNGLPIAGDGCGNFWVIDITPETTATAPIFFACHDAPVILYQCADIASFLSAVLSVPTPPTFTAVYEDRLFNVWRSNPGVLTRSQALNSPDTSLRAFASELPEPFQFIDLRHVEPGMGFSWGRYGPRTEIRRFGYERLFAYAKPTKRGFFGNLFGKPKS